MFTHQSFGGFSSDNSYLILSAITWMLMIYKVTLTNSYTHTHTYCLCIHRSSFKQLPSIEFIHHMNYTQIHYNAHSNLANSNKNKQFNKRTQPKTSKYRFRTLFAAIFDTLTRCDVQRDVANAKYIQIVNLIMKYFFFHLRMATARPESSVAHNKDFFFFFLF